jgi:hypothetical protein
MSLVAYFRVDMQQARELPDSKPAENQHPNLILASKDTILTAESGTPLYK